MHTQPAAAAPAQPDTTPAAPAYHYQAPYVSSSAQMQLHYRTDAEHRWHEPVGVFRWAGSERIELTFRPAAGVELTHQFDRAALTRLRDALNDALADIHAEDDERQRQASFDEISEEMARADEDGRDGTGWCYYAHPDVHYVPADQVAAKAAELNAAGVKRFMVLPEPVFEPQAEAAA